MLRKTKYYGVLPQLFHGLFVIPVHEVLHQGLLFHHQVVHQSSFSLNKDSHNLVIAAVAQTITLSFQVTCADSTLPSLLKLSIGIIISSHVVSGEGIDNHFNFIPNDSFLQIQFKKNKNSLSKIIFFQLLSIVNSPVNNKRVISLP